MANFYPINFVNLCVPPIPGIRPKLTSGRAKYAFSDAITISLNNANSNPPPSALPLTAAMIGFLHYLNPAYNVLKI
jgi:hypothetical protein